MLSLLMSKQEKTLENVIWEMFAIFYGFSKLTRKYLETATLINYWDYLSAHHIGLNPYQGVYRLLTHWPLGELNVILKL